MLETILKTVKSELGSQVMDKFDLSKDQSDKTFSIAGEAMQEVAEKEISNGNIDGLMNLFSGKSAVSNNNPIMSSLGSTFVNGLTSKLNLNSSIAQGVKSLVIPFLIKTVTKQLTGSGKNTTDGLLSLFGMSGKEGAMGALKDKLGGLGKLFG